MRPTAVNWTAWIAPEDVPVDLRKVVDEGAFVPLLDPKEAQQLRFIVLETFSEVLDSYLEDQELRWRMDHLHRARPGLPMNAVIAAVAVSLGVSQSRLRKIWYSSRRKSRVAESIRAKLKGEGL